jgi:hypothetical protein
MNAREVAAEIRADAFDHGGGARVSPPALASAARILASGLRARIEQILQGKPWYWRILFGRGLQFAADVLDSLASQIAGDYQMT